MPAVINPIAPVARAFGSGEAAPTLVLQPGTVIDARVLSVRSEGLVRILIAGVMLDVLTEVALQPGVNLKLAVSQTEAGVRLAIVGQSGAPIGSQVAAGAPRTGPLENAARPAAIANANSDGHVAAPGIGQSTRVDAPLLRPALTPAPPSPATPEAIALSAAAQNAAPRQTSLAPLFANLPVIVASGTAPAPVQHAALQLLAARPQLNAQLSANDLRSAFQASGLFLEASLATGAPRQMPDLKAALAVLRHVVSGWLTTASAESDGPAQPQTLAQTQAQNASGADVKQTPPQPQGGNRGSPPLVPDIGIDDVALATRSVLRTLPPAIPDTMSVNASPVRARSADSADLPEQMLRLASQILRPDTANRPVSIEHAATRDAQPAIVVRHDAGSASANTTPTSRATQTLEPAPPFRGAAPSAQSVASPSIAPDAPAANIARQLLDQTDAALARQTLLQIASLPDRPELPGANQTSSPRWSFEIPFATPHGTAVAQFEIARDGGRENETEPSSRVWRARFTLNVEPAGPVHAQVSLVGDKTFVRMWAERAETAAELRANSDALEQALRQAELEPGDILIGEGAPPQPVKLHAGHFLDRAT